MERFTGRTVFMTGGAGGMGASHMRAFVNEGARVVIGDIREERGLKVAAEFGDRVHFIKFDVRSESEWASAVTEAEDRFGPISVLINNAGVVPAPASIEEGNLDDFNLVVQTNLNGTWLGMHTVTPSLRRAGGGVIINIASISGMQGDPFFSPYNASKWAIRGITKTAAIELARDNVRVIAVCPGPIDTPLITEPMAPGIPAVTENYSPEPFAIKRLGMPQEITNLVLFLASDEASLITGSEFVADGGLLLGPVPA